MLIRQFATIVEANSISFVSNPNRWTSFSDVTDQVYFFDWHYTPNMIWIDLNAIPWESLPGTLKLLPQDAALEGNALCNFVTLDDANPNLEGCETTVKSSGSAKGLAFGAVLAAVAAMLFRI